MGMICAALLALPLEGPGVEDSSSAAFLMARTADWISSWPVRKTRKPESSGSVSWSWRTVQIALWW